MSPESGTGQRNITSKLGSPIAAKAITIAILTLLLLMPMSMIQSLIEERAARQKSVVEEIGSKWGRQQTVMGPIISIPYKVGYQRSEHLHFLPETLKVEGNVSPEVRYRGIFEAVLYNARLVITGRFSHPRPEALGVSPGHIDWQKAVISLGLSDVRGIRERITAKINGVDIPMSPKLTTGNLMSSGVSGRIKLKPYHQLPGPAREGAKLESSATDDRPLTSVSGAETRNNTRPTNTYTFRIELSFTGSERIAFLPVGESTSVTLSSDWPSPSFDGAYLPVDRKLEETGFSATWKILDLNRNFPQQWKGRGLWNKAESAGFGVGLITPVDFYQKSMRTTKYAILFVALTFAAFFISELTARVRLHPIQYLLIGVAITTFYTLLLSLSEHIGFTPSYIISAAAVTILVTVYAGSVLRSRALAVIVGAVMAIVYAYLYMVLQMVDYALVVGSVGLFVVISVIMFVTRHIDWYALKLTSETHEDRIELDLDDQPESGKPKPGEQV